MKTLFTIALLALATGVPVVTPAPAAAADSTDQVAPNASHGWKFAGKYYSYKAACCKANQLQSYGYDTCIKMQDDCYCVYCRCP